MIELTGDIDLEDILDGFDDMKRRARNLTRVWREAGPELKRDIAAAGRRKEGPDGRWAPLAPATAAKRRKQRKAPRGRKWHRKIAAAQLGKLRTLFTVEWGPKFIRAVSKIPWSGVHQEGGVVGRGSKIPARPHIYASEEFLEALTDRILRHITRVF